MLAFFSSMLLVGCPSDDKSEPISSALPNALLSIQITPQKIKTQGVSDLTVIKGLTQAFSATGKYENGTTKDISNVVTWKSSNKDIASVDGPILTGVTQGSVMITASHDAIVSNSLSVAIVEATLSSIQVTPPYSKIHKGNTVQLTVQGTYSNGLSVDITSHVNWYVSDPKIIKITTDGLATGLKEGKVSIFAGKNGIYSSGAEVDIEKALLRSIEITSLALNVPIGHPLNLIAKGTYSDSSTVVITSLVRWTSSDINIATISESGVATGHIEGAVTLSATYEGIPSNALDINVTSGVLDSLHVLLVAKPIINDNTVNLEALGHYSDGTSTDLTSEVTWKSSDSKIVSVSSAGIAKGVSSGTATIEASKNNINSNPVEINVIFQTLTAIEISAHELEFPKGLSVQLLAKGTYPDDLSDDISSTVAWISSDPSILTITSTGLATGAKEGSVTISAQKNEIISNVLSRTITPPALTSLSIEQIETVSNTIQLKAMAHYSDEKIEDVTLSSRWVSINTDIATVTQTGFVTVIKSGIVRIEVSKEGVSTTLNFSHPS